MRLLRFGSHDEISLGYKGNMKLTMEMTKTKLNLTENETNSQIHGITIYCERF